MAPTKPKTNSHKPTSFKPGQLVQYHLDGLRAGHILSMHRNGRIRVRPIGPYKATPARALTLSVSDLLEVKK